MSARRLDDENVGFVVLGDGVLVVPVAGRDVAGVRGLATAVSEASHRLDAARPLVRLVE